MNKAEKEERKVLVLDYLKRYPNSYKKTIARMLHSEHPSAFKDVEDARSVIRYYTGARGTKERRSVELTEHLFCRLAPEDEAPPPDLRIEKGKALIIGDVHSHFMTPNLHLYFEKAKEQQVDMVILNGDIIDNEGISKWPQTKRHKPYQEELDFMHEFLDDLSEHFPHARKIFKKGNHEFWLDRELWSNPNLMGADDIADMMTLENIMNLRAKGYEIVEQRQLMWLGKLLLIHGHEAKKGGMYIAKAMLEYFKCNVAFNHFHRVDYHQFQAYGGDLLRSYGLPCARSLHANYTGVNNQWKAGFAICDFTKDNFTMDVYIEDNGRIYRK